MDKALWQLSCRTHCMNLNSFQSIANGNFIHFKDKHNSYDINVKSDIHEHDLAIKIMYHCKQRMVADGC
jgi:hypothetical protein